MPPWMRPTVRAISWAPLAGVAACLALMTSLPAYDDIVLPASLTGIAASAVAASVVAGTQDPAAALLAAVPTPAAVRLARRLLLLVPTGAGVWALTVGGTLPGLLALTGVGLAVSLRAGVPLGVVAPLAWTALAWAAGFDWRLR
jgi:hypothetical protein